MSALLKLILPKYIDWEQGKLTDGSIAHKGNLTLFWSWRHLPDQKTLSLDEQEQGMREAQSDRWGIGEVLASRSSSSHYLCGVQLQAQ
jgi:hypothetical protein